MLNKTSQFIIPHSQISFNYEKSRSPDDAGTRLLSIVSGLICVSVVKEGLVFLLHEIFLHQSIHIDLLFRNRRVFFLSHEEQYGAYDYGSQTGPLEDFDHRRDRVAEYICLLYTSRCV